MNLFRKKVWLSGWVQHAVCLVQLNRFAYTFQHGLWISGDEVLTAYDILHLIRALDLLDLFLRCDLTYVKQPLCSAPLSRRWPPLTFFQTGSSYTASETLICVYSYSSEWMVPKIHNLINIVHVRLSGSAAVSLQNYKHICGLFCLVWDISLRRSHARAKIRGYGTIIRTQSSSFGHDTCRVPHVAGARSLIYIFEKYRVTCMVFYVRLYGAPSACLYISDLFAYAHLRNRCNFPPSLASLGADNLV